MSSGRARTIKPELLEDAITAGLSDTAFRLFVALIVSADDYGNFRAEPRLIEKDVYWSAVPERSVATALAEEGIGKLVLFYEVRGQHYGHIRNWKKHQYIARPGGARVPGPEEASQEAVGNSHDKIVQIRTESKVVGQNRADLDLDQEIEKERERERERARTREAAPAPVPKGDPEAAAIATEIRKHPGLADLPADRIATQHLGHMMATGQKLPTVLQAIDDFAAKLADGTPHDRKHAGLVGFMRRPAQQPRSGTQRTVPVQPKAKPGEYDWRDGLAPEVRKLMGA